jgi:hypothetical protein
MLKCWKNTFLKEKYFVKENEMFWNYYFSKWNLQILINYLIDVSNLPRYYGSYWKISPTPSPTIFPSNKGISLFAHNQLDISANYQK